MAEQGARKIRTQMLRVTSGHNPEQRYSSHGERPIAFIAPVGSHRRNGPTRPPPSMRRDDCHQVALGRAALGVPSQGTPAHAGRIDETRRIDELLQSYGNASLLARCGPRGTTGLGKSARTQYVFDASGIGRGCYNRSIRCTKLPVVWKALVKRVAQPSCAEL